MKPLVSILIPAYNAEPWIADTLQSALRQTWPRKEIIMVDDGSKDRTLAVAQQFAGSEVTVVTQNNAGASAARNKAFSLCKGDYIQWLDADDLLGVDKISRQMEVVVKVADSRVLFSSAWGRFMYRPGRAQFETTPLCADQSPVEWLVRKLGQNLHMQPATWLVSRQLTEAAGPWDTRLSLDDDGEYFCRVLLASNGVRFVPGAKSFYRMSGSGSLSIVDQSDKKLESLWLSMQLHVGYLRSLEESERTRAACVTYLGNWLNYFHPARPDIIAQAKHLAATLGGKLELSGVRPKYRMIERLFGREAARRAQVMLPNLKTAALRSWDRAMFQLERRAEIRFFMGQRMIIEAGRTERQYWRDLWRYRELFYFLAWRDFLVRYKQTAAGVLWSLVRPVLTMLALMIVVKFGKLSTGGVAGPLFIFAAMLPWQFFSTALSESGSSLITNANLVSKIYFPRLVVPASSIIVCFADFMISAGFLAVLMVYYRFAPPVQVLALPLMLLMALGASLGAGLWIAALMVKYRDFRFIVPFVVQFGVYASPVILKTSVVPEKWGLRFIYSLNPMVGVIDGFRWCLLGGENVIYWPGFAASLGVVIILVFTGIWYFRRTERTFADMI